MEIRVPTSPNYQLRNRRVTELLASMNPIIHSVRSFLSWENFNGYLVYTGKIRGLETPAKEES